MSETGSARVLRGHLTREKEKVAGLEAEVKRLEAVAEQLEAEKREALRHRADAMRLQEVALGEAKELRRDVGFLRDSNTDLKERLHHSEMEVARLQGYVDRVAEDDQAREGAVQVQETHLVPRRKPYRHEPYLSGRAGAMTVADSDCRARHWTGY